MCVDKRQTCLEKNKHHMCDSNVDKEKPVIKNTCGSDILIVVVYEDYMFWVDCNHEETIYSLKWFE